jgi:hypothetical protein
MEKRDWQLLGLKNALSMNQRIRTIELAIEHSHERLEQSELVSLENLLPIYEVTFMTFLDAPTREHFKALLAVFLIIEDVAKCLTVE